MLRLRTILRRMKNSRMVTLFNLAGLILCFFSITVIARYLIFELNTDKFHKNRDRIFAVSPYTNGSWVSYLMIEKMGDKSVFEKIIPYGFDWDKCYFRYENNQPLESDAIFVDSCFFEAFSFNFIAGDRKAILNVPFNVVITQSEAKRFFGNENPIGKKLKYNSKYELTVSGLISDYPANTIFRSKCFISFSTLKTLTPDSFTCGWNCKNFKAFVMLASPSKKALATEELKRCTLGDDNSEHNPTLVSLHNFYFDKEFDTPEQMNKGDKTELTVFSFLGILIFIITLFNYFNLSVASLIERRKDTAMMKIFGSNFKQHWLSIFSEAFILSVIALIVTLAIQRTVTSSFQGMLSGSERTISGFTAIMIPFGATLLLSLIGSLAGAIYISRRPVMDAYNSKDCSGKYGFQAIILAIQFCIVSFLIGSTLTTRKQVNFMEKTDSGFNRENLICIESQFNLKGTQETIKDELTSIPGVLKVTFSDAIPGRETQNWSNNITVKGEEKEVEFACVPAKSDFLEVYGFRIANGRLFSDSPSDVGCAVINETAAKEFGWQNPVGEILFEKRKFKGQIIGVVKDSYFQSMHNAIKPMVFLNLPGYSNYITLKVVGGFANQKKIITESMKKWQKLQPDFPFQFFYFDEHLNNLYRKEAEFEKLSLFLTLISIIITGLGLIGVSLFIARKKTKEIGIRRVNGATSADVVNWLNRRFYLSMLVSVIISLPFLWWFMSKWLQAFAYKTEISWWIFAVSGMTTIAVAVLCLSWQSWRAATRNPVEALRYE